MTEKSDSFRSSLGRWLIGTSAGLGTLLLGIAGFAIMVGAAGDGGAWPLILTLAAVAIVAWKWLEVMSESFEITDQRLIVRRGIIMKSVDEIELYRIKDSQLVRSWWMRPTGLASIQLETSDRTMPKLVVPAIPGGREMRELLRQQVELQRDKKRVREMDFDEANEADFEA